MKSIKLNSKSFDLLEDLVENNNRDWFLSHKVDFRQYLQSPFCEILEEATTRLDRSQLPLIGNAKTMFRMNRDTRFSKDKRPYKENVGGLLTLQGTKSDGSALLYVHLDADGGFVASGFYCLPTPKLNLIRTQIVEQSDRFRKVQAKIRRAGLGLSDMESLKKMPRGFESFADHEHASVLRMKSVIVSKKLSRAHWNDGKVVAEILSLHKATSDMLLFGLEAIEPA